MSSAVLSAAASLRRALVGFDPSLLSGTDCAALAEALAATEKACAGARLLAGARAVSCGAHKGRGFSDGAAWVARQVGATTGQARQGLETAAGLAGCPSTQSALLAGELSLLQAAEIAKAESEAPGSEASLVELAKRSDLGQLREAAREQRQARADVNELHQKQLRARQWRHWRDELGMVRFAGALAPETGVPFVNRLELSAQRARVAPCNAPVGSWSASRPTRQMPWRRWPSGKARRVRKELTSSSSVTCSPGAAAMPTPARCAKS